MAPSVYYDVECEVEETGVWIIAPKTVSKPELPPPFLRELTFCGYYGKFRTVDIGEEEVLCGANDPTGKDGWQPVPSGTKMEESGYHFFKYVLKTE